MPICVENKSQLLKLHRQKVILGLHTATLPPGDRSPRFPITLLWWCRKASFGKLRCNG
jgi:hypothetical protein